MADRGSPSGMSRHRFFLPQESFENSKILFTPEVSHQIRNVLRLRPNDRVVVLNGEGQEFLVRLDGTEQMVTGVVEERRHSNFEPVVALTLYQGLVKGPRFELVAQKCTEIGVSRFVPMRTARSVAAEPSDTKERRLEKIIREAAEQSRRGKIPVLAPALSFAEALAEASSLGPALLFWEEAEGQKLRDIEFEKTTANVGIFIGPEGGFTDEEAELARSAGLKVLSLGKRILRSETAAILSSGVVLDKLGEL